MAYFSNGSEGTDYCEKCVHNGGCAVLTLHYIHNYDECNNAESFLHKLIPRGDKDIKCEDGKIRSIPINEKCKMFYAKERA